MVKKIKFSIKKKLTPILDWSERINPRLISKSVVSTCQQICGKLDKNLDYQTETFGESSETTKK